MLNQWARNYQDKFFHIKYASLMVDTHNTGSLTLSNVTDVTSLDDLAKLAERFNSMILHTGEGDLHTYYVQGNAITYRFMFNEHRAEAAVPAYEAPHPGGES